MIFLLVLLILPSSLKASVICYQCHANSTEVGKFCSIDKLCQGTSCYFTLNSDNSWSAGCSSNLATSANVTCSTTSGNSQTTSSCSCNSDFCNSFAKSKAALENSSRTRPWWGGNQRNTTTSVVLTLPDRGLVHCEECGSVTVNNATVVIPCDHNHTCQGNYCVSVRGQSPYSYCGGVWDSEKAPACYFNGSQPETCICSMHMCNGLLDPEPIMTTTVALGDPTLATLMTVRPISDVDNGPTVVVVPQTTVTPGKTTTVVVPTQPPTTTGTTVKPTTKRKCKNSKLSPNDQAVFMGEKLKNVIMGGFGGEDGAVQNFEDDINDHICNYSDDGEEEGKK